MSQIKPQQIARYSRHILLPGVGLEGQEKLLAARVLVIGAGGLGSPVSLYLTAAGVGTLGIADFDEVEEHNLQRQIIHDSASVGRLKTESARERLLALNPELKVELHEEGVTPGNSVELFGRYDLVIDGTDNFGTRYLNNDAAFFAGKPLVYGSIFQFEGQVSLFDPQRGGPCYRCLFPRPPAPGTVPNCAEAGVFGALCGTVGSMQAMEAIKLLLSVGKPLLGRLLVIDALGGAVRSINVKKDPGCPLCSASASIREIAPANYVHSCEAPLADAGNADEASAGDDVPVEIDAPEARRILDTVPGAILLDVREPFEREICGVPGSVAIPLREVERNLKRLADHQRILVCCHHGIRSMQTTRYLRSQGFAGVSNVAGGIDAWARLVAPGMRRY